ncbi:DUF3307 domain-containing protein [Chloroflexia bacterium SDU3-3]|nr:DUF3307 domain-containing protein [Chloroflexia bacterium SDU3-3]
MFYYFFLAHLIADFALQPYWLVVRKRRWDGLLIHGGVVLLCMLALGLIDRAFLALWPTMLGITAVHIFADWWKVHRADRLFRPAIVPFLLDQGIHAATIAVALALTGPQGWAIDLSWLNLPVALAVVAYVIAGLAVPIGVMTWLDPSFAHGALAPAARARSFAVGALGVSLVLFAGALALPLGLCGLVVATRRQVSPHPLDAPLGAAVVLTAGAALGALSLWLR